MELTLVSYNIHSGIGVDGKFDLDRICGVLEEIDPDIVAMQEVGDFRGVTAREDHAEYLAEKTGMHVAYGANVQRDGRRYGNAVLSRLPILQSHNYDLSVKQREPRGALRCDVDLGGGKPLHVFCLHLGLAASERREQEALLLTSDILRDTARVDPLVLCGDFNYWGRGAVPPLVRHALRDVGHHLRVPARTFHSRFPFLRLDRMFVDAGVQPLSLRVHRTPKSTLASDHLPLVMRLVAPVVRPAMESPSVQLIG